MSGKIFYRERSNVGTGDKAPRYVVVAIYDLKLKIRAKHLRRQELEDIATATGAELVELKVGDKGHKLTEAE
jgi:hypothetical protein